MLRKQRGMSVRQAVLSSCVLPLWPVLITALVALLGLVPIALSQGIGSEVQRPLAVVVIGGLVSSTFLTLIILPVLYHWIEGRKVAPGPSTENHTPITLPPYDGGRGIDSRLCAVNS
jgi:cobalt-zinc-cadmium resistance protein CzcA